MGNQESRALLSLQCFNHFTSYEILHDIGQPYFDFARLDRIDGHRFGADANMEPARHQAIGKIRQSARLYLSSGDVPTNDFAVWRFHQLPGKCRCKWE